VEGAAFGDLGERPWDFVVLVRYPSRQTFLDVLTSADYAKAIRAMGVDSCILASDLGQVGNPLHPDGLVSFFEALRQEGFTAAEIARMSQDNPARALGLPAAR